MAAYGIGHEDHNSTYNMLNIGHGLPAKGRINLQNIPAQLSVYVYHPFGSSFLLRMNPKLIPSNAEAIWIHTSIMKIAIFCCLKSNLSKLNSYFQPLILMCHHSWSAIVYFSCRCLVPTFCMNNFLFCLLNQISNSKIPRILASTSNFPWFSFNFWFKFNSWNLCFL